MLQISIVEEQRKSDLRSGQKIYHDKFGRGIIVGFSEASDEPVVYFYEPEVQKLYENHVICVASETIFCTQ